MRDKVIKTIFDYWEGNHPGADWDDAEWNHGKLSDAILAALPSMVQPLVWVDAKTHSDSVREAAHSNFGSYEVLMWSDGSYGGTYPDGEEFDASDIGDAKNKQREIFDISRSLKSLTCELSIPLIIISQLSSIIESRQDHRPYLSDVRELNRCADEVLFLHREDYYNPTESNRGLAEVIMAKNRRGPVGTTNLVFLHEYLRFENLPTNKR